MSECKLDHTPEDVIQKFESQRPHMPEPIATDLEQHIRTQDHTQAALNELFHLLKKYDLASKKEQEARNEQIKTLLS